MNARTTRIALALSAGIVWPVTARAASTTRFHQAEDTAIAASCGSRDDDHAGYTGTGFANCRNDTTSTLEWTGVLVPTTAIRRLGIRYANGSARSQPAELRVNGAVVGGELVFPPTGGWSSWATVTIDVPLHEGENVVRLRGTASGVGLANIDRLEVSDKSGPVDWGVAVVESVLLRQPTPAQLGGWRYPTGLLLHGIYLVYQRTGDERYLRYIKSWVDAVIGPQGNIYGDASQSAVRSLSSLDDLLPGRVLADLYPHFPQANYRTALRTLRNRFSRASNDSGAEPRWSSAYPRTSDGGYWHAKSRKGELWLDGVYMGQMFLSGYGELFGGADETYADDEASKQLLVQAKHLRDASTGLLWHAYDEQRDPSWPLATGTNHSQEFWCRAMGWYGMTLVEVLEVLAADHPARAQLVAILRGLVAAWAHFQDPASGRWFQLVDKGAHPKNWTETSCSAMYAYVIARAASAHHVPASYRATANKGYAGVLERLSWTHDAGRDADLVNIGGISTGTGVGTQTYYFSRPRPVNDQHGLGAFLIMYEEFQADAP